jgi:hypothetical protein
MTVVCWASEQTSSRTKIILVKHESAIISTKYNQRRAKKDITEALEQLPSSKDISEAQRVF